MFPNTNKLATLLFHVALVVLAPLAADAQNLVLNPSFEDYSTCPSNIDQVAHADLWSRTTDGTSDYFNACATVAVGVPYSSFGYSEAYDGQGYMGLVTFADPAMGAIFTNYREYITGRLSEPLTAGQLYRIAFYVTIAEGFSLATAQLGAYVSDTDPTLISTGMNWPALAEAPHNMIPQVEYKGDPIQDSLGWTIVEGTFTAAGGETFITIGNFRGDNETDTAFTFWQPSDLAYYFVDAVTLEETSLPPIAEDDEAFTMEGTSVWIPVLDNDSDVDGLLDPASLAVVADPSHGVATADPSGEIFYEPDSAYIGPGRFPLPDLRQRRPLRHRCCSCPDGTQPGGPASAGGRGRHRLHDLGRRRHPHHRSDGQ